MHYLIQASGADQSAGTSTFQLWGVPIIAGLIFYVLGVATAVYQKRPKLIINGGGGSGSGSPTGFQQNRLGVQNVPGRLGMRLGTTVVFGRVVHKSHWIGWPVAREPAKKCSAWLLDETGEPITSLFWIDPGDHNKRQGHVDLESGERADLVIFAQKNDDLASYYPYTPDANGDPVVPPVKFSGTKRFIVRLNYSDGQQTRNYKYTVSPSYQSGHMVLRAGWRKQKPPSLYR